MRYFSLVCSLFFVFQFVACDDDSSVQPSPEMSSETSLSSSVENTKESSSSSIDSQGELSSSDKVSSSESSSSSIVSAESSSSKYVPPAEDSWSVLSKNLPSTDPYEGPSIIFKNHLYVASAGVLTNMDLSTGVWDSTEVRLERSVTDLEIVNDTLLVFYVFYKSIYYLTDNNELLPWNKDLIPNASHGEVVDGNLYYVVSRDPCIRKFNLTSKVSSEFACSNWSAAYNDLDVVSETISSAAMNNIFVLDKGVLQELGLGQLMGYAHDRFYFRSDTDNYGETDVYYLDAINGKTPAAEGSLQYALELFGNSEYLYALGGIEGPNWESRIQGLYILSKGSDSWNWIKLPTTITGLVLGMTRHEQNIYVHTDKGEVLSYPYK